MVFDLQVNGRQTLVNYTPGEHTIHSHIGNSGMKNYASIQDINIVRIMRVIEGQVFVFDTGIVSFRHS